MYPQAKFIAALQQTGPAALAGYSGFGWDWSLTAKVVGWVAMGLGLGKDVYTALKDAGEKIPPGEQKMDQKDVDNLAAMLNQQMPSKSKGDWASLIYAAMGQNIQPGAAPVVSCPPGYIRDPSTGACIQLKTGFQMPTWGWVLAAAGGVFVVLKSGILRGMGGSLSGSGCRDKDGAFVPVPQCVGRRRAK